MKKQNNCLRVQTNAIPGELTSIEIDEITRSISLYNKGNRYMCQTFFTPPRLGEVNWLDGLEASADVSFRFIRLIGNNLFHVCCTGTEKKVRQVCSDSDFIGILRSMHKTFTETVQAKNYLDAANGYEPWDAMVSVDKRKYFLANQVDLGRNKIHIHNIVIVGDRLVGLTEEGKAVTCQLTPEMFEKDNYRMEVSYMDKVDTLGKIDSLSPAPNSELSFLACAGNCAYQIDLHGQISRFQVFDDHVKKINHVAFNNVRSLFATSDGLYEIDVEELPQMVRSTGLPRMISHPELKGSFAMGQYVEDPYVLGVHPAMGILAKTGSDRVVCF